LAHMDPALPKLSDDPQPMRVSHRRQRRKQFIAGQFQLHNVECSDTCQLELTCDRSGTSSAGVRSERPELGAASPARSRVTGCLTSSSLEGLASASAPLRMLAEAGMSNWVRAGALD